jgi:hypothetical protein
MTMTELLMKADANHPFGDERDAAQFFNISPYAVKVFADKLPGVFRAGPAVRFDKRAAAEYAANKVFRNTR